MSENDITHHVIGCAIKIHRALGPGLLESAYEACLCYEVHKTGLYAERQKAVPLIYQEVKLDCGYRADLVVEKKVIVEIKSVDALNEIHLMQTLTHIKLLDFRLGLLMLSGYLMESKGSRTISNSVARVF